ncbi:uncharacterized protein LOC129001214 isoform X2 [Macrosteles quadrilineatus]|nr:uncharacterized protein LOC129001214 isoform X2 [Macrosteles quadrilineatus]
MAEQQQNFASDVPAETFTQCPDCGNEIERLTPPISGYDGYWVHCIKEGGCGYLERFPGRAIVSVRDLIIHGFPAKLLHHVNIYRGDMEKLMRISISEYFKTNYSSYKESDIEHLKCIVGEFAKSHGVKINFDYDINNMAQTVRKDAIVKKLAASMVEDIPVDYQEKIKSAFSKIQEYDFPNHFVDNLLSKQLPLFALLEEQEKEMRKQEAELREELKKKKKKKEKEKKNKKQGFDEIAEMFR